MKVLISSGLYPPKIGGPAQYAQNLEKAFIKAGNEVEVKTFVWEDQLPTGARHIFFFFKILPSVLRSDFILTLDTFSVALPTVFAATIFNKRNIIRTGGDFLWEQYVERTGKKVLFRDFYNTELGQLSLKEKIIFHLTRWVLMHTDMVVFSTLWQRDIFIKAYGLKVDQTSIVENYYGPKEGEFDPNPKFKNFLASARDLKWKNVDTLKHVFYKPDSKIPQKDVFLTTSTIEFDGFMEKMRDCYAVILVSLGDISPNLILDSIRYNKPFICTKEVGILDRIKDIGIFVDPLNEQEIEDAVLRLLDDKEYESWCKRLKNYTFTHTWDEMVIEYTKIWKSL